MLFYHQIIAERYKKYRSTRKQVCFTNMTAISETEVIKYILKIVITLTFQMVIPTFDTFFNSLDQKSPKRDNLYIFLLIELQGVQD